MKKIFILTLVLLSLSPLSGCKNIQEIRESSSYRANYLSQILLPEDYPDDAFLPYSSSVEFPDGVKITVDFSRTERYKNQFVRINEKGMLEK